MGNETWEEIQEIYLRVNCTDDPEFKAASLKHNQGISEEASRVHKEAIIIDGCVFGLENYNWMLMESGATAINLSVPDMFNPNAGAAVKNLSNAHWAVQRCPDELMMVNSVDDILLAKSTGRIGAIAYAMQPDFMLHRDLVSSVEVFAAAGFKVIRLAGEGRSFIADSIHSGTEAGITDQGKTFLGAMADNGITADLTDLTERSFYDAIAILKRPVICTGGVGALYPHPANLSDSRLKAIADNGGVICLSANPELLYNGSDLPAIERYVDAILYAVKTVGVDSVGIGTGLCAQPGGRDRHAALTVLSCASDRLPYPAMYSAGWGIESTSVMGMDSIANLPNLTRQLLSRGITREDVKKLLGGNLLRVFLATWK